MSSKAATPKSSESRPSDQPELADGEQADELLKFFCQHVVCLTGTVVPLDAHGHASGPATFFNHCGFVVSFYGHWILVTAGHILKEIEARLARKTARYQFHLGDQYGLNAKTDLMIPFDYENQIKAIHDDDKEGLDFGLIPLSLYYRRVLEDNGVRAIGPENWLRQHEVEFDLYAVLGMPDELFERRRFISPSGATIIGGVRAVLMFAMPSAEQPLEKPVPTHPWLVAALKDRNQIKSIRGMSGGPIFGFKLRPGQAPLYWVVAIQSWWDKDRRIVFGSRLATVMRLFEMEVLSTLQERVGRSKRRARKRKRK
jgi:hypothetical protein